MRRLNRRQGAETPAKSLVSPRFSGDLLKLTFDALARVERWRSRFSAARAFLQMVGKRFCAKSGHFGPDILRFRIYEK